MARPLLAVIALCLTLTACGGRGPSGGASNAGAPAPGGGLTVDQALASDSAEPLLVRGHLQGDGDGPAQLCGTVGESYPPYCGKPTLTVEGVSPDDFDDVQREGAVWWVDDAAVLGRVRDGVLTVDPTSL